MGCCASDENTVRPSNLQPSRFAVTQGDVTPSTNQLPLVASKQELHV